MSDAEMQDESGPTGTQEFHPSMDTISMPDGGSLIWDPTSRTYIIRQEDVQQPLRTQVPGMPAPETFQEKTKNPQFEGVFASIQANLVAENSGLQAQQYREIASTFAEQAAAEVNPTRQRVLKSKEQYYNQLAERVHAQNPAHTQAENSPPDAQSQGDVYNSPVPKRNPEMTDDSYPGTISHHIPKVTSMLNTGRNSYTDPETPNLRDCPEGGCGGKMMDSDGESHCHDCGHKEKVHYAATEAAFLAPLLGEGVAAGIGEAAGSGGLTNALRAGSLMQRVMGGGGSGAAEAVGGGESPAAGSAVADENMHQGGFRQTVAADAMWDGYPSWQYSGDPYVDLGVAEEKLALGECTQAEYDALLQRAQISRPEDYPDDGSGMNDFMIPEDGGSRAYSKVASSVSDEDGLYGNNQTGHDSEPDSGNKASEGQDQAADELVGDNEGDAGGSAAKDGEAAFALFLEHEPHLQSIADNDDSHEDEIAMQVHDALEKAFPGYLKAAARMEISKIAGGTCPTCHIDLTTAQQCGGAPSIQCPVGLPHAGSQVGMQGGAAPMIGQPTSGFAGGPTGFAGEGDEGDFDEDSFDSYDKMPPVPSAEFTLSKPYPQDMNGFDPSNKNTVQYVSAPGSAFSIQIDSDDPSNLHLLAGDMGYHDIPLDYLRQNGPEATAQTYDETGAAADIQEILDAALRLLPGGGSSSRYFQTSVHEAKRPKMCPAHDALVTYALTLQNPAAALQALSGELFGANSCQGGYEMMNSVGNPTKCKYKPEMVTQAYWDEKDAAAEERKLQREQQQALLQQVETPEQFVDQIEAEPEGQLVGGPELDAQLEQVEEKAPITQDIPDVGGLSTTEDYMPREQGEVTPFPQFDGFQQGYNQTQVAAHYKWSGPGMLTPELAPSESPEQMLADTPPEELPADTGVSTDDPLDSEGNPIEVGVTYEVQSPMNDDFIPDRYKITAVDPNLIQFEVESQADKGKGFSFTDTLSTQQIKSDGLRFTPASDSPNATGDVAPSGSSDNTGEGDMPGSVTDLDTGGNSHASAFVDMIEKMAIVDMPTQLPPPPALVRKHEDARGGPAVPPHKRLFFDKDNQGGASSILVDNRHKDDEGHGSSSVIVDKRSHQWEAPPQGDEINALYEQIAALRAQVNELESAALEHQMGQRAQRGGQPTEGDYGNPEDDGTQEEWDDHSGRMGATLEGNAALDWLNEDSPVAKTAGRDFSPGEQRGFVNEVGAARNLDKLDLSGTHYPGNAEDDPYYNFGW